MNILKKLFGNPWHDPNKELPRGNKVSVDVKTNRGLIESIKFIRPRDDSGGMFDSEYERGKTKWFQVFFGESSIPFQEEELSEGYIIIAWRYA